MSSPPSRDGKYLGEVAGDWIWMGEISRWVSADEPQAEDAEDAEDTEA